MYAASHLYPAIPQASRLSNTRLSPPQTLTHSITSWVLAAGPNPDQATVNSWAKKTRVIHKSVSVYEKLPPCYSCWISFIFLLLF